MGLGSEEGANGNIWTPETFRSNIIAAVKSYSIVESKLPMGIDIGRELMGIGEEMLQSSLADPHKRERWRIAKINLSGEMEVDESDKVADISNPYNSSGEWYQSVNRSKLGSQYDQYELPLFDIHTHPLDLPPSGKDLAAILYDGQGEAELIFGPQTSYLVLRTLDTQLLTLEAVKEKSAHWTNLVKERYKVALQHARDEAHYDALAHKAALAFVRDVSKKYHLPVFTVPTHRSSTFTRAQF